MVDSRLCSLTGKLASVVFCAGKTSIPTVWVSFWIQFQLICTNPVVYNVLIKPKLQTLTAELHCLRGRAIF